MLRSLLVILFVIKVALVWSQSPRESKALKELSRQQWDKSRSRYTKMLRKDTLDVEGYYIKSLYFFSPDNPHFNLDTAYESVNKSLYYYETLTLRDRDRLQKVPLDSALLRNIRKQIDSAAFVRAEGEGTESAYTYFLEKFPTSVNYGDGLQLLHDVAFETALQENTYEAFDRYLKKYPDSHRASEARENYDRLFFETKTRDKRLATYRNFLLDNPQSPYVKNVEEQIMLISTANGDPETFRNFIHDFPKSHSAKKAGDILYYLVKDEEFTSMPESIWSDSLANIYQQNRAYLAPFYESGLYGFMDEHGTEIIPASSEEIDEEYLCGNIVEDVLIYQNKIIARNGVVLFADDVEEMDDLGYGYLFVVTKEGKNVVLHKSGFVVCSDLPIEDARLLSGKFISLKCNGRWSLYTLSGRLLIKSEWDEIKSMSDVLALRKNDKWHLLTNANAALIADTYTPDLSQEFDEIKLWSDKEMVWVRKEDDEGLLTEELEVKLPLEKRTLRPFPGGMESQGQDSTMLYSNSAEPCGSFKEVKTNQYWVGVRQENKWWLYAISNKSFFSPAFDSIAYKGIFAIGLIKDSVAVYFDAERILKFKSVSADFIATRDTSSYLLITKGRSKSLYNFKAEKLFESTYDNIQFADRGTFVVTRQDKKGLVSESGKMLLPVTYDAIGDGDGEYIPLLRNTKFGLYNVKDKQEIKPLYDKNLRKYNETLFVAFKNGSYGIIDSKSKTILPFNYEDVQYWNDTSAFVKANSIWQLFDLKNRKITLDNVKDFKFIAESENESVAIVRANNYYGVLSTLNGVVIPIGFTDIVNVGSREEPLYFTEKHVEEASIYVVIYYDKDGKLLRRYIYDPDEYEKIYCSKN